MVKRKKSKRNYKGIDVNTVLIIVVIAVLIFGYMNGWFGKTIISYSAGELAQLNFNDDAGTGGCKIALDKKTYCLNDWVKATMNGEPSTEYLVGMNIDDAGWFKWGTITTDSKGYVLKQGPVKTLGNYKVRAISETCISNLVEANVILCEGQEDPNIPPPEEPTGTCTDTDGGYEVLTYGVCTGASGTGSWDFCSGGITGGNLAEQSCDAVTNECIQTWHTCHAGYICMNGACQQPECTTIVSPTSQADCDIGYTTDGGECIYVPGNLFQPAFCYSAIVVP